MTTDQTLASLDRIETALTAAIVELIRQRNDIRRERCLITAHVNPPQAATAHDLIVLDNSMREMQETAHA